APGEMDEAEKLTVAGVAAYLLVFTENRDTQIGKDCLKEFRKEAYKAFTVLFGIYARGIAKTSRTSLDISTVKGMDGALANLAGGAMETCYESRKIDFGSRKFDTTGAVKLINGLVRLGQAVSEGDQLWSAVENFALPLGLVRKDNLKLLDPESNRHHRA